MSAGPRFINSIKFSKQFYSFSSPPNSIQRIIKRLSIATACITPGVIYLLSKRNYFDGKFSYLFPNKNIVYAKTEEDIEQKKDQRVKINSRESRFYTFASINYNGDSYMTPQDFLESVTKDNPRLRKVEKTVGEKDISAFLNYTPGKRKASKDLFRQMGCNGLISYTEYLFLLCVLTKPESGFRIAFNMFDTDMNQEVDKKEFLVMERVMQQRRNESVQSSADQSATTADDSWFVSKLLNKIIGGKLTDEKKSQDSSVTSAMDDIDVDSVQNTTLLTHFFGPKGKDKLNFQNFKTFMQNLQTEVLEIEFMEYSRGMSTMSESEFARVLLRYTTVRADDHEQYVDKIRSKIQREEGITFDDYHKFFLFLNSLDDFTLAMKMYTLADRPISKDEFQQAVKACTGYNLNRHLVETVFHIFDEDGDGQLSYREFVHIMKDRLSRDNSSCRQQSSNRWEAYRHCVMNKMRDSE